ncbi:uncharacterized protein LOC141908061 [Tubulanus polymorphus]|uniref:uncharacterized protein LOC141908061 n=1 Tax=Tubulanus polymorphus TaxID=672921 RepID=UPI003DA69E52
MYDKIGQTNFALRKPTSHSGNRGSAENSAKKAVDGKRNGTNALKTCSFMAFDGNIQWWRVDLQQDIYVTRLIIASRTDSCCLNRLENFNIFVTDVPYLPASNDTRFICHAYRGIYPNGVWYISCDRPLLGRYVTIATLDLGILEFVLCEVEVYGIKQEDLNTEKVKPSKKDRKIVNPAVIMDNDLQTCGKFNKNNPVRINLAGIRPRARHRAPLALVAHVPEESSCSYALESDVNVFFPVGGRTAESCRYWQRCVFLNHYVEGRVRRCEFICEHADNKKVPIKELMVYSKGKLCEISLGSC